MSNIYCILSYPPILSHPILVPSHPILFLLPIPSRPIISHPIPSRPIPSYPRPVSSFCLVPSHPTHPIPSRPIISYPIPSYPILLISRSAFHFTSFSLCLSSAKKIINLFILFLCQVFQYISSMDYVIVLWDWKRR